MAKIQLCVGAFFMYVKKHSLVCSDQAASEKNSLSLTEFIPYKLLQNILFCLSHKESHFRKHRFRLRSDG